MISVFALKPSFLFHSSHIKKKTKTKTCVWGCLILEETGFMEQEGVTLEELKKKMADFAKERDWDQFHSPRNLLLALVGEVGELSEIFQWKGEVPRGLPGWEDEEKQHLGEELSDVLLYLVRLSDICGVDLGKAALRKMELNAIKYPVKLCKGSSKKHTQFNVDSGNTAAKDQGH